MLNASDMHALASTDSSINDEKYTPKYILDYVKDVLGIEQFNYDFASSKKANEIVKAVDYCDKEIRFQRFVSDVLMIYPGSPNLNGSSFWLNPPFSQNTEFIDSLVSLIKVFPGLKGAVLTNANVEVRWFRKLASISDLVVFPSKRISFLDPETLKPIKGNKKPQAIFFIGSFSGESVLSFKEEFTPLLPFSIPF